MRTVDRYSFLILFALALGAQLIASRHELRAAAPAAASASAGVVGSVKLEGAAPHQRAIDMSKEPACAAQHKSHPITAETVVAGQNGGLANVVVYVSEGWQGGDVAAPAPEPALSQTGCQYQPHVLALDVNQRFKVTNNDQTSHNVHAIPKAGSANQEWNRSQSPGAQPIEDSWKAEEVAIRLKCNIHPWMNGYMVVVKGPYGVSDAKGSYKIHDLPPGSYTLTAWQEVYGTQTQKVTVTAGKPATANFTFKAR